MESEHMRLPWNPSAYFIQYLGSGHSLRDQLFNDSCHLGKLRFLPFPLGLLDHILLELFYMSFVTAQLCPDVRNRLFFLIKKVSVFLQSGHKRRLFFPCF